MAKDIKLEQLLGITKEPLETMSHAEMLSNNLKLQHDKISKEIYLLKNSFTFSGGRIDSTNEYAPVLGDLTIFIAFVSLFDFDCNDATAFFAMV